MQPAYFALCCVVRRVKKYLSNLKLRADFSSAGH